MSRRNYGAMGDPKLLGCAADLDTLDAEDRIKVTDLMNKRGLPWPRLLTSPVMSATPAISHSPIIIPGLKPENLAQNAQAFIGGDPLSGTVFEGVSFDQWIMEPKWDGIRILAHIIDDEVHFYTRTATDKTGYLPYIEAALLDTFPAGTWLDGEVVALNPDGTQNWGGAQSVLGSGLKKAAALSHTVTYVIFDALSYPLNGLSTDIRTLRLEARREIIGTHLSEPWVDQGRTLLMPSPSESPSQERYDEYLALGYEGAMLKRKDSKYGSGKRGYGWFKLKATDEADVVIMGFKPGEDSFSGLIGAVEFGQYQDGILVYRGRCSGMTMKVRQEMTDNQDALVGSVMSVAYMTIMPSGALRHPQMKRMRDDKPAEDCEWTT